jgi:hypothetical protein
MTHPCPSARRIGGGTLSRLALACWLPACVSTNVVVVDQKTALERQVAGDYDALENDAEQAGLSPAPESFTRDELAAGRERQGRGALGELAELYAQGESDAEAIDRLLLQRCVGEAESGLLVPRPGDCIGAADSAELVRVIGRENLHRRTWSAPAEPGASSTSSRSCAVAWSRPVATAGGQSRAERAATGARGARPVGDERERAGGAAARAARAHPPDGGQRG